jgi:hypothetical protein
MTKIAKVVRGYIAHAREPSVTEEWQSIRAMTASDVITELTARGADEVDILSALNLADPLGGKRMSESHVVSALKEKRIQVAGQIESLQGQLRWPAPGFEDTEFGVFMEPGSGSWRDRKFTREFKLEAVKLIRERGVAVSQASHDLGVHHTQLRK